MTTLLLLQDPVLGKLQPFYKKQPVTINKNFDQRTINLFYQVNNIEILSSETFTKNILKLIKPGKNIPNEILIQTKTITEQYTTLNQSLYKREKYLNPSLVKDSQNCEIVIEIFKDSTATYLLNEIAILAKDLPDQNTDIQADTNTRQRTSGILMQAILDINEIIFLLNAEIAELENILNHVVSENILVAIQESSCIKNTLMEKIEITKVITTKTGLMVRTLIYQFEHTNNAYDIVPTSYLGKHIDFTNTFLIEDHLTTCNCLYNTDNIYTGCTCSPFNQKCSTAIIANDIKTLITDCPFIQTQNHLPLLTYTGILFPSYQPFTIENSEILNSIPSNPDLPFHLQTPNPVNIATKHNKLTLQAATKLPEELQTLNLSSEDLNLLTNFMIPIKFTNILNYVSWSIGGFSIIILFPLICGLVCHFKKYKSPNPVDNNQRRAVQLKLTPFIF